MVKGLSGHCALTLRVGEDTEHEMMSLLLDLNASANADPDGSG